jgi:hypothetical protein
MSKISRITNKAVRLAKNAVGARGEVDFALSYGQEIQRN